jgi:hypothetical protein
VAADLGHVGKGMPEGGAVAHVSQSPFRARD